MEHAIPGFAAWQLSSVPRFLVPEDVERVIGFVPADANGLRDRAVILLLARLGLRASEVARLMFADIDWSNGRITVCGKGRRQEWLPLPQEVGAAILLYLRQGRPPLAVPEVFTTVVAPVRPLTRAAVTHIVRCGAAPGRDQGADQRRPRPPAFRRHRHAPSGRIAGRRRCGPAPSLAQNDGSLRQGGFRSPVGDRPAMAGGIVMLTAHVERYIALRQTLGFKLRDVSRQPPRVRAVRRRQRRHPRPRVHAQWTGRRRLARRARDTFGCGTSSHLARFLHAEDPAHEVPPSKLFHAPKVRSLPYIYAPEEIAQIVEAAGRLRDDLSSATPGYATLLGLIAATGLRISEALDLRLDDVLPDGVLRIRQTKFGKSRLVPLHPTVAAALDRYLELRRRLAVTDDHLFLSAGNRRMPSSTVNYTFRRVLRLAGIAPRAQRPPRIHDLRHTFATRALEQCSTRREAVARHFVALATYLGHADIAHTYWYLEATPELMTDIAAAAEALVAGEGA